MKYNMGEFEKFGFLPYGTSQKATTILSKESTQISLLDRQANKDSRKRFIRKGCCPFLLIYNDCVVCKYQSYIGFLNGFLLLPLELSDLLSYLSLKEAFASLIISSNDLYALGLL